MISVQTYSKALLNSVRLLPVSLFALSQSASINTVAALQIFLVMHVLILPAVQLFDLQVKNGNNKVISPLFFLDVLALFVASFISFKVMIMVAIYSIVYKIYFHSSVRIKRYAMLSALVVMITNGALLYLIVEQAVNPLSQNQNALAIQGVSILVGAFYLLSLLFTQKEDEQNGDITLLARMGLKRTINLGTILLVVAVIMMLLYFFSTKQLFHFYLFLLFLAPMAAYLRWFIRQGKANAVVFESKFTVVFFNLVSISFTLFALVLLLMR